MGVVTVVDAEVVAIYAMGRVSVIDLVKSTSSSDSTVVNPSLVAMATSIDPVSIWIEAIPKLSVVMEPYTCPYMYCMVTPGRILLSAVSIAMNVKLGSVDGAAVVVVVAVVVTVVIVVVVVIVDGFVVSGWLGTKRVNHI